MLSGHSPAVTAPGCGPDPWAPASLPPAPPLCVLFPVLPAVLALLLLVPVPSFLLQSLSPHHSPALQYLSLPLGSLRWGAWVCPLLLRELMTYAEKGCSEGRTTGCPQVDTQHCGLLGAPGTGLALLSAVCGDCIWGLWSEW